MHSPETRTGEFPVLLQPNEIVARAAQQIPDFSIPDQQELTRLIKDLREGGIATCVALANHHKDVVLISPPHNLDNRGRELAVSDVWRFARHGNGRRWNIATAPDAGGRPDITTLQQEFPGLEIVDLGNWPPKVAGPNLQLA